MQVNLPLYPYTRKFALAAPGTTNYIFSGSTSPSGLDPKEGACTARVTVSLATSGKLYVGMTDGTSTNVSVLNADTALAANTLYTFTFEVRDGVTYDLKLGTDGIVNILFVSEVGGGIS